MISVDAVDEPSAVAVDGQATGDLQRANEAKRRATDLKDRLASHAGARAGGANGPLGTTTAAALDDSSPTEYSLRPEPGPPAAAPSLQSASALSRLSRGSAAQS